MSVVIPELGGVPIYTRSGFDVNQTYESEEGSEILRMLDGAGIKQTHWRKVRTSLSGKGIIPASLSQLDYSASMVLKSCGARSVVNTNWVLTLPTARRTDVGYCANAVMPDGSIVSTAVVVVTNTATCVEVSGAIRYIVWYYPQITVFASLQEDISRDGAEWTWTLDCEEV